jgi:hypothetical protein
MLFVEFSKLFVGMKIVIIKIFFLNRKNIELLELILYAKYVVYESKASTL